MIAVIEVKGKQFCIQPGKQVRVPKLTAQVGETVTFDDVLHNAKVTATVKDHVRAAKVMTRKFRNKTRYARTKGHRQTLTVLDFTDQATQSEKTKPTVKKKADKETV